MRMLAALNADHRHVAATSCGADSVSPMRPATVNTAFLNAGIHPLSKTRLSVSVVKTVDELRPYLQRWEALAASALEPNVFYEPWQVMPALQTLTDAPRLELLLVLDSASEPPALRGVFPLERCRSYRGLPLPSLRMWQHKYLFLCTPLVSRQHAHDVLHCFVNWLSGADANGHVMSLQGMRADGLFADALKQALDACKRSHFEEDSHQRALLEVDAAQDSRAYLESAVSKKKTKEYRRLAQRLSEQGEMQYERLQPGADVQPWLAEFLSLEASGWKGREDSAVASTDADRRYFTEIVTQAHARGRLALHALRLDGVAIAMKCNFVGSAGAWSFKIGFEEKYAKYSPGVLLELENIRNAFDDGGEAGVTSARFPWMDSCAKPDHPMIDHLWRSSRAMETRVMAAGGWRGQLLVRCLPALLKFKRRVEGLVRGRAQSRTQSRAQSPGQEKRTPKTEETPS
jgi:CelD/BcsL family acetyltransferase involved in cellulose biosynthesis